MTRREKHIRVSEREKELVKSTKRAVYGDDDVPMGVVISRACRSLLADDSGADNSGVSY